MKKLLLGLTLAGTILFTGCQSDAQTASINLAVAAENFEIDRKIVFINTWTDKYLLMVEGKCSIENQNRELEVTCKKGKDQFFKHNLGLSKNVTYVSQQLEPIGVNVFHTRVIFKPQSILRDFDFKGDSQQLIKAIAPDGKDS